MALVICRVFFTLAIRRRKSKTFAILFSSQLSAFSRPLIVLLQNSAPNGFGWELKAKS
jgi:hypothetical protein